MTRLVRPSHFRTLAISVSWLSALVAAAVVGRLCVQKPSASATEKRSSQLMPKYGPLPHSVLEGWGPLSTGGFLR